MNNSILVCMKTVQDMLLSSEPQLFMSKLDPMDQAILKDMIFTCSELQKKLDVYIDRGPESGRYSKCSDSLKWSSLFRKPTNLAFFNPQREGENYPKMPISCYKSVVMWDMRFEYINDLKDKKSC